MRYSIPLLALGAALTATPALAQLNVGLGGQAGANVGVGANTGANVGGVLGGVTDTLDRTVNTADRTVNRALDSDLRLATRAEVRSGVVVRDSKGRRVGTVQSLHGNTAIVVQGGNMVHVPLAALYRSGKGLVTSLTDAQLRASASANARAKGHVHN